MAKTVTANRPKTIENLLIFIVFGVALFQLIISTDSKFFRFAIKGYIGVGLTPFEIISLLVVIILFFKKMANLDNFRFTPIHLILFLIFSLSFFLSFLQGGDIYYADYRRIIFIIGLLIILSEISKNNIAGKVSVYVLWSLYLYWSVCILFFPSRFIEDTSGVDNWMSLFTVATIGLITANDLLRFRYLKVLPIIFNGLFTILSLYLVFYIGISNKPVVLYFLMGLLYLIYVKFRFIGIFLAIFFTVIMLYLAGFFEATVFLDRYLHSTSVGGNGDVSAGRFSIWFSYIQEANIFLLNTGHNFETRVIESPHNLAVFLVYQLGWINVTILSVIAVIWLLNLYKKYSYRSVGFAILFGFAFVEMVSPLLTSSYAMALVILSSVKENIFFKNNNKF